MSPQTSATGKHVWCSYCGQKFTRKEHLERHLPTHTNIKPHMCPECNVDFNRRDLLTRHITTYHEKKSPGDPTGGTEQTMPGNKPAKIACANCAQAKTACDKGVPCQRCKDKNYDCAQRYARRPQKAATRAATAGGGCGDQTSSDQGSGRRQSGSVTGFQQRQQQRPPPTQQQPLMLGFENHVSQSLSPSSNQSLLGFNTQQISHPFPPQIHSPGQFYGGLQQTIGPGLQEIPGNAQLGSVGSEFYDSPPNCMIPQQSYGQVPPGLHGLSGLPGLSEQDFLADFHPDVLGPASDSGGLFDERFGQFVADTPAPTVFSIQSSTTGRTRETSITSGEVDLQQMQKDTEQGHDAATSQSPVLEHEDVVRAEASWPLARCNRLMFSNECPRTPVTHTTFFERSSKGEDIWKPLQDYVRNNVNWEDQDLTEVVKLKRYTRDRLAVITQGFLHKVLNIHGSPDRLSSRVFVLPDAETIQYFLRSYVRSLSVYYSLVSSGSVDPNDMLASDCDPSTLLILLMTAQGAAAMPEAAARYLSTVLTEMCRISLFDSIEKNVKLSAEPVTLRCALLLTLLGSWSGDKWLMDIAMGQRGMYMSMLKHSGMLESQPFPAEMRFIGNEHRQVRKVWEDWESRNRLVYNWVMLDHELSLFHDTVPHLAVTELLCPLPAPESTWTTTDPVHWLNSMRSTYHLNPQNGRHVLTPSLSELFRLFLENRLPETPLTPQQLRLLLHPINATLFTIKQLHACLPAGSGASPMGIPFMSKVSTRKSIQEVQNLLARWYALTDFASDVNRTTCPLTRCNLVLYHLMYLNTVTDFQEIEKLARQEGLRQDTSFQHHSSRLVRCIFERENAILHSAQVLRLLREMPANRRPSWWTVAMYRAVLVLWANSLYHPSNCNFKNEPLGSNMANGAAVGMMTNPSSGGAVLSPQQHQMGFFQVAIDELPLDSQTLNQCIWQGHGIPVLVCRDGMVVGLDGPLDILEYGIRTVGEAESSRIGDGIRRKLGELKKSWENFGVAGFGAAM